MSQPSGATQRRRRDGRPVETVPPPARQAPPPDETGLGAVGLTAAVLGGAAGVGAAVAPITAAMPTAQAIALSSAAILASFERFLDGRDRVLESGIFDMLEEEAGDIPEGARLEVVTEEMAAERAYRAKLRARLDRDLPTALMIDDPGSRELEVRKILDRERRIVGQREEAIAVRALGNVEARVVEAKSPEGAYWKLSEFVREHTRDCLAMAGKVWPWTVLRTYHPPLHTGCGCELVAVREAVAMGLPGADRVVSPELAFHAMQVQESSYDVEELEEELRVLEARYGDSRGERYATGTTKGGQFKPRRGATPGRPTGLRMRHRRRTAFDLLDTPDAAPRATPGSPARITKKKGGEMQVGDEVLVGGEWRRVEGVDPKTKGYVVLDGFGPALLDPETSFDVRGSKGDEDAIGGFVPTTDAGRKLAAALKGKRTFDEILAASESVRVDDLSPDELAALERLTDEAERRGASGGEQPPGPDWAKVVRELETMKADHVWSAAEVKRAEGALRDMPVGQGVELKPGTTLRRERHGWIVTSPRGVQAKAQAESMAGSLAMMLQADRDGRHGPDTGLAALPDEVVKRYADARLEQNWATERRLIVDNLIGMRERGGLERLRYDWRAKLRELDLGEADLTDVRRDELRAKAGEADDAARAAGRDVYVEFLRRRDAFEIVDHSGRLKSKPFEIRPRDTTVGAIGGDAFLRDSGANLRLSRFATRDAALKALEDLHTRELGRLGAEDAAGGTTPGPVVRPPEPPKPEEWDADGYSYGPIVGLPALQRWGPEDRFELRWRKDAALVMWDRQANDGKGKPYAVWEHDFDVRAIEDAVLEQNIATRQRQEAAPPAKLTQAQVDQVVSGKAPAAAGEIVPGFHFTGEAGRAAEAEGVLNLPVGFFKQSKAIREKVVYRHLGRRLYAEFGDEEIQQMTSFPGGIDVPGTYAALNSPALQGRLEALEPEKSALVARLAVKHGLPLSPQARDWLEKRGIGVEEPDTRAGARGGQADPVELVDAKALAAELGNLDSGTWHTVLAERGYGTVGLKMDGGQITGATWRDVRTGAEIVTDSQAGTATARINRGPRPGVEVTSRIHDSDSSALGELGADGWVWDNAGGGSGAGDTWHRLVHPDGRAFEVYEASNGTLDSERAFTYEPEPEAVESARKRWITTNPAEALREGDSFDRLETALSRAGWQTALDEGRDGSRRIPLPDNAVRLVRLERGDVSVNVVVNPDGRVHSAGYGYRYPDTSERWSEMLTREEHDRRIAELNAEREAEAERVRQRAEADRKAAQGKTSALESWIEAAYSSKGKRAPKVPDDVAAGIVRGRPTNDVVKDLKANGWDVVKAGRGRGKAGPTLSYKLRKMEGPGAGSTISIKGGGTFVDPSVHEVKVTINPQRGRRDRLAPGEVWKDVDELYVDALGRADELGERYGAGVHVTAIYDEGAGAGAAAHHDWSGAIVMGTGQKFRERFNAYLAKRRDGTASHRDHVDFYDALSTLQHEVNHGVAARGPGRGGLAFQSSNYRHDWDRAMEEALTEESARALTLDWLRAQGMTDVLAAVKGMSKSDYRYVGSYTGPRQALENLLRAAGVSDPDERRRLIFRMKFEMTPAERMSVLDDPIIARSDEHAKRRKHMPGSGDMTGHGAPYSPTKVIMGGGWRGRGPASHRGEFAPVIDDPLDDVEAAAPTARLSNGRQVKPGDAVMVTSAADPTQPPQDGVVVAFDGDFVKVRTDDGLELWRNVNRLK